LEELYRSLLPHQTLTLIESTMASRKWDAYSSLNITSGDSNRITCVGMNKEGRRCGWEFRGGYYNDICTLLSAMERRPPMEAIGSLKKLARLSLCQDWHQNQAYGMVAQWESAIMEVAEEYEMGLRRRIHVQADHRELQVEIERLRDQPANEQANSTSVTNQWTTQQRYEDQEKRTEEYRRAFLESERKVRILEEENTEISRQLAVEKGSLELARRQCEENSATSSRLENGLYARSIEYQESLSQKAQTIERTTAERDNLRAELVTLESQLSQLNERSIHMGQEIDRATTENVNLSMQVENLTRELDLESKTSSKYQSDLLRTRTHRDTLAKEVDDLRSQLDMERKKSSRLVLDLEQAETSCTTLSNEKRGIQSRLESEYQKYEELTAELSQLKIDQATLSNETEALRIELASEHKTSARLHQELSTTKEDLPITRNHPFKTFSTTLIDIFKRRAKVATEPKRNARSSKRIHGTNDPEVNCST
jgi:chromosome segregation ATPase